MKKQEAEMARNQAIELAGMKKSQGWKIFEEEYLLKRQKTLLTQLLRCKPEEAAIAQARLKELNSVLKFFGIKQRDGVNALKLLTEVDQAEID